MRITNRTRQTLDFIVAGAPKDGVPPTGSIEPGETKDLDVRADDPVLAGRMLAGAVSVEAARSVKPASAPSA